VHPVKVGLPGEEKELLDGVAEIEVRSVRRGRRLARDPLEVFPERGEVRQRRNADEVAEKTVAPKGLDLRRAGEVA
jgi:hypothetical protein